MKLEKVIFLLQMYFATQFVLAQVKIISKISYLGKQISILHRQMTEQLLIEVDVKNVTDARTHERSMNIARNFYFICLGCVNNLIHAHMHERSTELLFYLFRITKEIFIH